MYADQLNDLIVKEFVSFFKNRFTDALHFVPEGDFKTEDCISAKISLSGNNIKGILAVVATKHTLLQCHPERRYGDEITDEDLKDWIGEIVNRGLGNMKNALLGFNIDTTLNPPYHSDQAFTGEDSINAPVARFVFSNGKESVCVLFQAELAPEVVFDKTA